MLFINGLNDKLFPVPGVKKAYAIMHDVWNRQKAGDRLVTELRDITHSCGIEEQKSVLDFMNKFLRSETFDHFLLQCCLNRLSMKQQ